MRTPPRAWFEDLYARYNRRRYAADDPVSFLYAHGDPAEREITGLIAALLAYGRIARIMRSVADVLARLRERPRGFLLDSTPQDLRAACAGFRHRVVKADRLWRLLWATKDVLEQYGSVEQCFAAHDDPCSRTVLPGLEGLATCLGRRGCAPAHLVARPGKGSACKRWMLFLRWMVRTDEVDPGGWTAVDASRLIVPLDVHMLRVCRALGFIRRKTASLSAALEATEGFRRISPEDPVRYDFALMHASLLDRSGELLEGTSGPQA